MKMLGVIVFILCTFMMTLVAKASDNTSDDASYEVYEEIMKESEISKYIEDIDEQLGKNNKSVEEMTKELISNKDYGFSEFFAELLNGIKIDLGDYRKLIAELLFVGFSAALFSMVTMAFSKNNIGEYGFYAAYAILFGVVLTAFINASVLAVNLIKNVVSFMKVVAPGFAMAMVCAGNSTYGTGVGQLLLIMCATMGLVFVNFLISGIRIYLVLGMSNSMLSTDKFSHLSSMIAKGVGWMMRTVFVFFCGLSILQKMFWPAFDSIKNTVVLKTMSVVPVVGTTMNAAGQTVLGAFMVLKGSIGTLAVLFLVSVSVVPILKVFLYYVSFNVAVIIIQPVCDKRFTKSIKVAAKAAGLLTCLMLVVVGLFIITLAIATG